jgi:hypothetical protein
MQIAFLSRDHLLLALGPTEAALGVRNSAEPGTQPMFWVVYYVGCYTRGMDDSCRPAIRQMLDIRRGGLDILTEVRCPDHENAPLPLSPSGSMPLSKCTCAICAIQEMLDVQRGGLGTDGGAALPIRDVTIKVTHGKSWLRRLLCMTFMSHHVVVMCRSPGAQSGVPRQPGEPCRQLRIFGRRYLVGNAMVARVAWST